MAMRLRATRLLRQAVRDGIVTPWPICAMPACRRGDVVAHHTAYDYGDALFVTWLCRQHHAQLHVEFLYNRRPTAAERRKERKLWHSKDQSNQKHGF